MKAANKSLSETPKLGEGIYLQKDIAEILMLPAHKVRYALNTYWRAYSFGEKNNKAVNFFALIEFYTYYHLREKGFTSKQIKDFHDILSKGLKTDYPFASVRVLAPKEKTQKSKIWYEYMGNYIKGDGKQQPTINSFVKPFLKQIEFGEDDQLAKRFYPFNHTKNVVVDPHHQFGQPVINGTNLQTKTIFRLHEAGESAKNICKLYNISERQVDDAVRLHSRKAA